MRKLTAWEGAIGIVPPELDGAFVSPEFPTFTIDRRHALPEFLGFVVARPSFWSEMLGRSTGTVMRRKRLSPAGLLSIAVDLPPLAEQRRIVDLVLACEVAVAAALRVGDDCRALARSLRQEHFAEISGPVGQVGTFFEVTMGRQRSPRHASGANMLPYLRAANVKDGRLDLADIKTMNFTPAEQTKYRLESGDVLITEGCGSIAQLGASAQWVGERAGVVCFQNTLLRLRSRLGRSLPGYAQQWARYAFESGAFASIASGTNIFHIGAERIEIMPVVMIDPDAQGSFIEVVEAADTEGRTADDLVAALRQLRSTLLDDLLGSEHRIPASYESFLAAV